MATTERSLFVVTNYRRPYESKHRLRRAPPVISRVRVWTIWHAQQPFKMLTRWARRLACQIIADRFARRAARRRTQQDYNKQRIQHPATLQLQRDSYDSCNTWPG
jgi:hypothetical protein